MKESDRMLQWCPHRRTTISFDPPGPPGTIVTVTGNAMTAGVGPGQIEIGTCIGHQCSQWRWDSDDVQLRVAPTLDRPRAWIRNALSGTLRRVEPLPRPPDVDASFVWDGDRDQWRKLFVAGDRPGHCGISGAVLFD